MGFGDFYKGFLIIGWILQQMLYCREKMKCSLMDYSERLPSNEQVYYQYSRVGGGKSMGLLYIKTLEMQVLYPFFFFLIIWEMLFWSNKNIENDRICLHSLSQNNWTLKLILDRLCRNFFFRKISVLKSGPVWFFALQGLRLRLSPVHLFPKRKKTGPRLQKTEDHGPLQF